MAESSSPLDAAVVRMRLRITVEGVVALGPGKVSLLEAVAQHGSITAAAKSIGMSYRRGWLLLDELNRALRSPAIETLHGGARGGGARLTPTGEAIVELYRQAEKKALEGGGREIDGLLALLR